ncbi:MAG: protein kinase [Pseudomonadota bacterium]
MSSKLTPQDFKEEEFQDELKPGTELLHGQYTIEQFLNNGGFGITYLAKDSLLRLVVIKECFPESICRRANSTVRVRSRDQAEAFRTIVDLFIEEARGLARLSHPNIVGVHQVFEDNDTAYMAMDFVEGRDLLEIAEGTEVIAPDAFERIAFKLLDAVEFIHTEGVLHRDISPDNILLSTDNEPVLIDFGAARESVARDTSYLGSMRTVKDGYSPQEFYIKDSEQHPSSDLYSLAASLYHVMTKELPVKAQARMSAIAGGDPDPYVSIKERVTGYSDAFLDAIDLAMQVFPKDRIQSAAEWRSLIAGSDALQKTRGSVSRPMLAVDNGNVLEQFEGQEQADSVASRQLSSAAASVRSERPTSGAAGIRDNVASQAQVARAMAPGGASSGKGLYFGVAVIALVAAIGVGALMMGGDDATEAANTPVAAAETPAEDQVAAVATPAPTETAPAETASRPEPVEQVPFFLADTSQGDVVVSSAAGSRLDASDTGPNPLTGPSPRQPSQQIAGAGPASELSASQPTDTAPVPAAIAGTRDIDAQDISSVNTGKAVRFDVVADPADPALVASADGPLAEYLTPGVRVVSINGFPITSLSDFQRVVDATSNYAVGDSVTVAFGIENPSNGETFVRSVELQASQLTMLSNGVSFETVQDEAGWVTVVTNGNGQGVADLQTGDRLVALMPTNELIDGQDTLPSVLERELEAGTTQFNFAVNRDGDMWLVSMPYAATAGN